MNARIDLDRKKLYWIGAMLAPSVVVLGVQAVGGWNGPSGTNAQAPPAATPSVTPAGPAALRPIDPAQSAALAYLRSHAFERSTRSPMLEPAPRIESLPDPAPSPPTPEPSEPAEAPRIHITAIVQSARGSVAAVGHRLLRIGDEVADGWLITAIDASDRVVRVRHADGRTAEYTTFSPRTIAP